MITFKDGILLKLIQMGEVRHIMVQFTLLIMAIQLNHI